jgi:hypothetical protein
MWGSLGGCRGNMVRREHAPAPVPWQDNSSWLTAGRHFNCSRFHDPAPHTHTHTTPPQPPSGSLLTFVSACEPIIEM